MFSGVRSIVIWNYNFKIVRKIIGVKTKKCLVDLSGYCNPIEFHSNITMECSKYILF